MESTLANHAGRNIPVILLAGPTGVGKTALAIKLAQRLGTEIINADSLQVYRHMDIGTAKPTPDEQRAARHHLLDVVFPDEPFDAARYAALARPIVHEMQQSGRPPLVVGGTGLYIKTLTKGICPGPPSDPVVRRGLLEEIETVGTAGLHRKLMEVDPPMAARLHPNDKQRILRALEVFLASGRRLSQWQEEHGFREEVYPTIKLFLVRPREELYDRINRRVDAMMEQGFLDEVQRLLDMGYGPELKPMQSLGYKQLARHVIEGTVLADAIDEIKRESRRYAKRQLTWFRSDPELHWLDPSREADAIAWVGSRLAQLTR